MIKSARPENFTINPEIQQVLPTHDIQALEEDIKKNGQLEPITVWDKDGELIVINGHHRLKIIKDLGLEVLYVERNFANLEEAKLCALEQQLQQRNLNNKSKTYAIGVLYRQEKHNHGGEREASCHFGNLKTCAKFREQWDVSERTVMRSSNWSRAIDLLHEHYGIETKNAVLTGKQTLTQIQAEILVKLDPSIFKEHKDLKSLLASLNPKKKVSPVNRVLKQIKGLDNRDLTELASRLVAPKQGEVIVSGFNTKYSTPCNATIDKRKRENKNNFLGCFRILPPGFTPRYFLSMDDFEKWSKENNKPFERRGVSPPQKLSNHQKETT